MSINHAVISGNLTRDVELRKAGNTSILNFSVAVNDTRNDANGNWVQVPNYVDCVMFGTRADKLASHLRKGSKVALSGKLRYSQWEKDGQKRSKLEIVVDEFEFMAPREQQQNKQPSGDYVPYSDISF